ncbi:MAG: hypothetical protein PHU26_02820 [Methanofollis liminatans]|jgi:uncharacterized membrane protein|uniref:DUF2178 domain-containing protein n=1 Tax=Methanofollis liminatans DSM 4140 TaxID=28892 RepID=J1ATA7_9EURY|nr:hypothetical protein [Methanofollis liminatans]EJG08318.1 hypothetical protein Metli_2380 [Methanofollis liminatans DSM 4140]MDD3111210.1 hypothetical protein [Methanofollis liminatans]
MKKSDLLLLSGALLLAAGFLIAATWPITEKSLPSMLLISGTGALFMALGLYQGRNEGKGPEQDERTMRIVDRGFRHSWYCTFAGMIALIAIGPFVHLGAHADLFIALCWMTATAVVFQGYYSLRGDV